MANREESVNRAIKLLVQEVTEDGQRDLGNTRLDDMENEVYSLLDLLSKELLQDLLQRQAQQQQEACATECPTCGTQLQEKKPQTKTMRLQRTTVHWSQPVRRCPKCRRDFFPSGQNLGL